LIGEIRERLEREGFSVVDYSDVRASVDLIAKRGKEVYVLKILSNADALKQEHARDMIKLADLLNGTALVIAERNRTGPLKDGVLYYRYGVPAVNEKTFLGMLEGQLPDSIYVKGREVVELDRELLRKRREELGLSLQKLAELADTTKETIYRYERGYFATRDMAERLESILGVKLKKGVKPQTEGVEESLHYPFDILKNLGGTIREFHRLPWEAIGKGRTTISFLEKTHPVSIKRYLKEIERGKGRVYRYYLFIGKRLRGVPYIEEEEIFEAKNFREIEKIARERNEER
jgi:predicted transcriptional regulator